MLLLLLALCPVPSPDASAVLRAMAHDDFATREAASLTAAALPLAALPVLQRAALRHQDVEVRHRAEQAAQALVERCLRDFGELPMLDALWYDGERGGYSGCNWWGLGRFCEAHVVHLLNNRRRDGRPWANYRLATGDLVRGCLADGVPPWVIRPVLWEMHRRDAIFLNNLEQHERAARVARALAASAAELGEPGGPPDND